MGCVKCGTECPGWADEYEIGHDCNGDKQYCVWHCPVPIHKEIQCPCGCHSKEEAVRERPKGYFDYEMDKIKTLVSKIDLQTRLATTHIK